MKYAKQYLNARGLLFILSSLVVTPFTYAQPNPVDTFVCPAGGEPLAIYSNFDGKAVATTDEVKPAYVMPGFTASNLSIQSPQQSPNSSTQDLVVKARNPADTFIEFQLQRQDGAKFWVTSIQFPTVRVGSLWEANEHKYMSLGYAVLDDGSVYPSYEAPVRNYNFDADYRLNIFQNTQQITGKFNGWTEASSWDGALNPKFTDIPFRFDIEAAKDGSNNFEGYGAWICGELQPQSQPSLMASKKPVSVKMDSIK
ncbi:hypothetical protein D5018_15550 [Parashewanella curva]|uniref:Uncharacterized protein n=1 Tax=Parashewanella curva TaxID=2338552 RepID=A0A3L8PTM9_9GAMM|nr:hypothetical protein [Parashewanella curva]RLV58760.1 hypothetical protein D5018_15550 [Parashewanella curva]